MTPTEERAFVYLQLNGFFLIPQFTILGEARQNHIDLLAYRPANSQEIVHRNVLVRDFVLADVLRRRLGEDPERRPIGIAAEVKTGPIRTISPQAHLHYVTHFFGGLQPQVIIFRDAKTPIRETPAAIHISNRHVVDWISIRIQQTQQICRKHGSWYHSGQALGRILEFEQAMEKTRSPRLVRKRR